MSEALPKERQTAYQRWEMASFGEPEAPPPAEPQQPQIDTEALLAEAREQIAAAREQARREGLAEGLAQGYQTGMEQGRAQALEENTLLQQLSQAFGAEIAHAKELVAQDLLDLALDLAKAMLKTALAIQPERVLPHRQRRHRLPAHAAAAGAPVPASRRCAAGARAHGRRTGQRRLAGAG